MSNIIDSASSGSSPEPAVSDGPNLAQVTISEIYVGSISRNKRGYVAVDIHQGVLGEFLSFEEAEQAWNLQDCSLLRVKIIDDQRGVAEAPVANAPCTKPTGSTIASVL